MLNFKKISILCVFGLCMIFLLSFEVNAAENQGSLLDALNEMTNLSELETQVQESEGIERIFLEKILIIVREMLALFKELLIFLVQELQNLIISTPKEIFA